MTFKQPDMFSSEDGDNQIKKVLSPKLVDHFTEDEIREMRRRKANGLAAFTDEQQKIWSAVVNAAHDAKEKAEFNKLPKWIQELVKNELLLETETAKEAGALGFYSRSLVMCTMPYKDPHSMVHQRRNGNFSLTMLSPNGVPFGIIPRILMAWISSEAVKTQSPVLKIGDSLADFLHTVMDLQSGGGKRGNSTRVFEQMKRLLSCHIDAIYEEKTDKKKYKLRSVNIADEADIDGDEWDSLGLDGIKMPEVKETTLWIPQKADHAPWKSELILNKKFFNELTNSPVPIDMRALKLLRNSPIAVDAYMWLTYKMSTLKQTSRPILWESLMLQFGSNYKSTEKDPTAGKRAFKREFETALKAVLLVYPDLRVDSTETGLILHPSRTHVPKTLSVHKQRLIGS